MIPVDKRFKTGLYDFPDRDIDPKEKTAEYCMRNSMAIYALYCQNQTSWGIGTISRFATSRLYSRGEQSVEQYKDFLVQDYNDENSTESVAVENWDDLVNTKEGKRMGWLNINWKNLSPAPAIMNSLHGMFDKMDFDLYVNTIDADSRGMMEDEKYRRMVEAKFADWQVEFKRKAGIPVDEQMIYPRTQEEFDVFEAQDGFKLAVAVTMQKLLRHSFDISKWDSVVRKKVIDDLICLGYGAVRDYFDSEEGKWKVKYLDPAYLIIQYSNEFDYHDADFAAYLGYWTISNLRNKLPHLSEEEIKKIAYQNHGKYGNPTDRWEKYNEIDPTTKLALYNNHKVPILECEWMDFDSRKHLYYRNRHGRDLIIDLGYSGEVRPLSEESKKKGARQEIKKIGVRQPYQCSWVIGTDHVFDWGKVKMASRDGLNKPSLTFHVEQLLQPAIIQNLEPILDEITMLYLRYQNSVAMMVERGYAINTGMLGNVDLGGGVLPVGEVVKMWQQTGRLLYSYGTNTLYTGGAALPVTPIDGGLGTRVEETIQSLEFAFRKIELFTGISLMSLGVSPDPKMPVGTTKEALMATANVLKPILDACFEIKESAGTSIMRRLQIGIRNSEQMRKTYKGVVSPTEIEGLVEMEGHGAQYGLTLKARPDEAAKARFDAWIELGLANSRENRPGIDLPDGIYFRSRLDAGEDINDLERQLRYAVNKNKQEREQSQMANIQAQSEQLMQQEAQKHQNELEKINTEGQISIQEELIRGQIKDKQSKLEGNQEFLRRLLEAADAEAGITTGGNK